MEAGKIAPLLPRVLSIVNEAGGMLLRMRPDPGDVRLKGPHELVTEADRAAEDFLSGKLRNLLPGSVVVSEESSPGEVYGEGPAWIVDPLDGTTNYVHGWPHFAVSAALVVRGEPVLGVVCDPASGETFWALVGGGAYLDGRAIRVSSARRLRDCLIGFGFPYDRTAARRVLEAVGKLLPECRDLKRAGLASLDVAYVAAGRLDAYFEPGLKPWDYAAGALILKEAGGVATAWDGSPLPMGAKSADVLASNGLVHSLLRGFLGR